MEALNGIRPLRPDDRQPRNWRWQVTEYRVIRVTEARAIRLAAMHESVWPAEPTHTNEGGTDAAY